MFGTRQKEDVVAAEDVLPGTSVVVSKRRKVCDVDFDITIKLIPDCFDSNRL